jgi:hypothetical protein
MESADTKALLGILPAIVDTLDSGGVLILDELVEALHPILSQRVVEMFQRKTPLRTARSLFSAHTTQIFFTFLGVTKFGSRRKGGGRIPSTTCHELVIRLRKLCE